MRLAISNIAWSQHDDPAVLDLLHEHGVTGLEIAPTKVWPDWAGATPKAAVQYARRLADLGFTVPALQAILFGRPALNLFGPPDVFAALRDHIRYVAEVAAGLGARVMVFGSPRNRDRGSLSNEEAFTRAVDAFSLLGEECLAHGVRLCIEPNPVTYGCNFVTTAAEGARLVQAVGSPGFGLHLDAGGMFLGGEDAVMAIHNYAPLIDHFHASEPELGTFEKPLVDHGALSRGLRDVGYKNWVSIEMRSVPDEHRAIAVACACVRRGHDAVSGLQP